MAWKIVHDGEVYREADLTIDQCERMERLTGKTWLHIAPLASAKDARAILSVLLADRKQLSPDEASKRAGQIKVNDWFDIVTPDTDADDTPTEYSDGNPQSAGDPSTST